MFTLKHSLSFSKLGLGVVGVAILLLNACVPLPSDEETTTPPPEVTATITPEATLSGPPATPLPLPEADVVVVGTSGSVVVVVGQTIAVKDLFKIKKWRALYDPNMLALHLSPDDVPPYAGWLFEALKPGKVNVVFEEIRCSPPPPSDPHCLLVEVPPMVWTTTVEVVAAP